jgi:hypothetical protein
MPEKQTLERAREDAREGKSPSTQAGEFVREEMHHIREGKHGGCFAETGYRNRTLEGPARGRKARTTSSRQDLRKHAAKSGSRLRKGPDSCGSQNLAAALARPHPGVEERRPRGRIAPGSFATGTRGSPQARIELTAQCGRQGQPNQKEPPPQ